jgi:glycosyltransferase involved in cell wall biosynthesis
LSTGSLRVAVIAACPFPLARGTPVRVLRLSEALADRGHDVHVYTYHLGSGPVGSGVAVHRIADVPSYRKLGPGPSIGKLLRLDPMLTRLARRAHREQPFDAIHAHHYEGLMVGAAMRFGRRIPLVYDAHTMLTSELPSYSLGLPMFAKRGLSHALDRLLPALADHTVCVSQKIRDTLVDELGMRDELVSVMANGVEFEHFDPAPHPPPSTSGAQRVIFTGNLAAYQGLDHLLRAFQLVLREVPDARLAIGTDDRFDAYESLSAELGIRAAIDILPSPSFAELPRLLASAHVAVNPRVDCDGVPVKLLNYMAAGRAVVSFEGSAPGVTHRENGWLARSGDAAAMAEGIVALLRDVPLRTRLGAAARDYVGANSRWASVAERSEKLYRRLQEEQARRG